MKLPIIFRPIAQGEFDEAMLWYEEQRPGLGDEFVAELERTIDSIANQPDRYPVVRGDVREAIVSRFPYCVYYRVKPDRVVIVAVFHGSRDPAGWQSRV